MHQLTSVEFHTHTHATESKLLRFLFKTLQKPLNSILHPSPPISLSLPIPNMAFSILIFLYLLQSFNLASKFEFWLCFWPLEDIKLKGAPIWVLFFYFYFLVTGSESFIGVNYGQVADNLPSPSATAKLLQSTAVQKVRLYGADPAIIRALANTGIEIVIGAANGEIPALASDPNSATQWINSNVLPYYPASKIILITVGNEVI